VPGLQEQVRAADDLLLVAGLRGSVSVPRALTPGISTVAGLAENAGPVAGHVRPLGERNWFAQATLQVCERDTGHTASSRWPIRRPLTLLPEPGRWRPFLRLRG